MAHQPMFESDPAKPASGAETRGLRDGGSSTASASRESDLAELAAKFTLHGGGRLSAELSADLALEIVLNEIVEQGCLATGATGAAIVLERVGEWVCRASAGIIAPELGSRLDAEAGLSGACVKTGTVQRCDDAQNDPRADMEACKQLGIRSVMILPLLRGRELVGVFEVFSPRQAAFAERDERTLEALSQRVLKNLKRASEPLLVSPELPRKCPTMAEIILEDLVAEGPVAEGPVAADRINSASASISSSSGINKVAEENVDAKNTYASSRTNSVLGLAEGAGVRERDRGINLVTWGLGVTILSAVVLFALLAGQRLTIRKLARRAHARASVMSRATGERNQNGSPDRSNDVSLDVEKRPESGVSSASSAATGPVAAPARLAPPPGSLLVYEKGREIFRLPPAGGTGVERASAIEGIEPDGLNPVSAEGGILHRVEPEYPEEARQKGIEGAVVVDVNIDRDGKVMEVKTVSGSPVLATAVSDAVKQWVFKPHSVSGHLLPMQTRITLNFRLPH